MNLILLGAPGAGKGTQGALLAERQGLLHLATGELLREAVREGTALGRKARKFMDAGELVPDDVMLDLVRDKLAAVVVGDAGREPTGAGASRRTGGPAGDGPAGNRNGYVLDGYPRNVEQAEALNGMLAELNGEHASLDAVVVIDVPTDVLVKRLSGRRSCTGCGMVYNIYYDPPGKADECDACGGKPVRRADDDPATVRRRLEVYHERTEPVVAYYEKGDIPVRVVDGDRPADRVHRDIVAEVGAIRRNAAAAHGARA